eukprot:1178610-Prorocentrum_minimum.AAC.1
MSAATASSHPPRAQKWKRREHASHSICVQKWKRYRSEKRSALGFRTDHVTGRVGMETNKKNEKITKHSGSCSVCLFITGTGGTRSEAACQRARALARWHILDGGANHRGEESIFLMGEPITGGEESIFLMWEPINVGHSPRGRCGSSAR